MTTTATITQLRVPQTPTAQISNTTSQRFDALLGMTASAISSGAHFHDPLKIFNADQMESAYAALCEFIRDPLTNNHMLIRELAMALATMISPDPLPLEKSFDVANAANDLSMQTDVPSAIDWDARERQARHTASLMFAVLQQRQRLSRRQQ